MEKKTNKARAQYVTKSEIPKTIPCPIHGQMLTIESIGGKQIAICRCTAENNPHYGQTVWERPD